jgi:predicted MFS family arabinose efflux permease
MAESIVPALGPVVGALLISVTGWRASFWVLTALTAALLPFLARVTGRLAASGSSRESVWASLGALVREGPFIRYALAYAIMFGALVLFVFAGPQIVTKSLGLRVQYFSLMQVLGVSSFIAAASQSGRLVTRLGIDPVMRLGAQLQILASLALTALGLLAAQPFFLIVPSWCVFCAGLGLRGPSLMAKSLESAGSRSGQASGLLMFLAFGATSAGTAAVAPFLFHGLIAPAAALLGLVLVSAALTF